jgi:hypothetical protein
MPVGRPGARRFGGREVERGRMKGSLHVASQRYVAFLGELDYLEDYLSRRVLPREPEDRTAASLLLILQNLIEYELERVIEVFVQTNPARRNVDFLNRMKTDFVTFKTKFEWAHARQLLTDDERNLLEEIRTIRNAQTHARPEAQRVRLRYFGKPLLTRRSIQKLLMDVDGLVLKLRAESGNPERWEVVPPGYAEEAGWRR